MVIILPILDGVDEENARLYNRASSIEAILDHVFDRAVDFLYFIAIYYIALSTSSISQEALLMFLVGSFIGTSIVRSLSIVAERGIVIRVRKGFSPATRDVRIAILAICTMLGYSELELIYLYSFDNIHYKDIYLYIYVEKSIKVEARMIPRKRGI